ncbi:penicillin acylase family protein [Sinimarinibacterium flocculans]|uniref:penicillin acylase family protein n=1 Tax=Sinimarinibacterium flocculans TaxID=985250 RepID=UPI0035175F62
MRRNVWAAVAAGLVVAACGESSVPEIGDGGGGGNGKYDVTVTRTTLGIPHIKADDYASMGYGYGYAFAEDNLCVLQEDLVTIRGERARYFGRDGSYTIIPSGVTANNLDSDFFWRMSTTEERLAPTRENTLPEFKEVTAGFVDGYNRYIRELKSGAHPGRHAACADADWLFEIETDDMYRRYLRLAIIASSTVLMNEIANARPLLSLDKAGEPSEDEKRAALQADPGPLRYFTELRGQRFGSNMYALGREATQDGSSMVFGNPHFPWTGPERLYVAHATIPGELDIMGSSLYGVPAILIGFNDHFAWSHTVSTAYRFGLYELTLNPLNPLQYIYDGEIRDIEQIPITIDVLEADGTISQESRTLYRSHFGPMLVLEVSGIPVLGWTPLKAYTMRDANAENDRLINQFARWNQAESLDEFVRLHGEILGVPWVNTVASGPDGQAYYGDITVVPNVPDSKVTVCQAIPIHAVVQTLVPGLPVLDGSRADCEWDSDPDAPAPGIFGRSNLPTLARNDWVGNFNDSYWLTNPAEPITGYARIIGDEETERTLRTRLGIRQIQQRLDGSDGLAGTGFTLPLLQEVVLSSRILSGELAQQTVLDEICPDVGGDAASACAALAGWNTRAGLDSTGAHVWREFWYVLSGNRGGTGGDYWATPFSADDPVNTPRDLDAGQAAVQEAFEAGAAAVAASGFDFDAPLRDIQHPLAIEDDIPIFGGQFYEGAFTIADSDPLDANGYEVEYGNSYIHTVTWDENGVHAEGFVTYSQSTDPANPHFADYTREYSAKRWYKFPFTPEEIAADRIREYRLSE